jgi:outer membrane immunogenic protein
MILALPLLAGLAATPAYAQSVTGRAELKVGYDQPRATIEVFNGETTDFGKSGIGYGAEVGGDATIGSGFLFGAYAGIDLSQAHGCHVQLLRNDPPPVGPDAACIKSKHNIYAGLRAGLTVGTSGLVYVKGGLSRAKFRASYGGTFPGGIEESFADSGSASGWHVGAGFEVNVTHAVYVKGEYVHTNYRNTLKDAVMSMSRCDVGPGTCRFNPTRQQVMFGVGMRFGGATPPPPPVVEPVAPPPPPPAPATQTCPDGTVIDATATCPAPPPPPAPPATNGERG